MLQRHDRIEARRATRRYKTRQRSDRQQDDRHDSTSYDMVGLEAVDQGRHQAYGTHRQHQAHGKPAERQRQSTRAKTKKNIARRRTQRHAHTNFVGALHHGVGEYAIQAERRQQQGEQRECAQKRRTLGWRGQLAVDNLLKCPNARDRLILVDGPDRLPYRRNQ